MNGDSTLAAGLHSLILIKYPILQTYSSRLNAAKSMRTTAAEQETEHIPHHLTGNIISSYSVITGTHRGAYR